MACGCGGACCGQKGLGFLAMTPSDVFPRINAHRAKRRGIGFLEYDYAPDDSWYYEDGGGNWYYGDDYGNYYEGNSNSGLWAGWDSSGSVYDSNGFWGDSFDAGYGSAPNPDRDNSAWQSLVDWWRDFTGGYTGGVIQPPSESPSIFPPFSGYCPPNSYCIDFPTCSQCAPIGNDPVAKAKAAAQKAQQQQAAQQAAKKQQQQQPCPPNTGLVKNAQGQCVCPPPYQFSKSAGKCVLASQLTAADKKDLQSPDWLMWAILAGVAVLVVRR